MGSLGEKNLRLLQLCFGILVTLVIPSPVEAWSMDSCRKQLAWAVLPKEFPEYSLCLWPLGLGECQKKKVFNTKTIGNRNAGSGKQCCVPTKPAHLPKIK